MRCSSRLRKGKRVWRCTKDANHVNWEPVIGSSVHVREAQRMHSSMAGGRRWYTHEQDKELSGKP